MNIETVWSWFEEEMSVMINMNRNIEQNIGLRPPRPLRGNVLANLINAGDITFSRSKYSGEYQATSTFFSLAENFFDQYYRQEDSIYTGSGPFVDSDLQRVSLGLHTSAI